MADVPDVPEWLAIKITRFIRGARTGQVVLNFTEGRVQTYDLRESGKIGYHPGSTQVQYASREVTAK